MTVLIGVPQELEEAEDPEVQIVLLIAVKQKVCSCMSALQLKLINIRDLFVFFFIEVIGNICLSCSDVFLAFLKTTVTKPNTTTTRKNIYHVSLFIFTGVTGTWCVLKSP